jgi:uncharacterized LabA/DUF88 family protein
MGRIAVFVDAGYFWVQAVHIIHGKKLGREAIVVNYPSMRSEFLDEIKSLFPESTLLRIYWYDGPALHGKADSHNSVEALDDFKLRLGTRTGTGDQKAVDGLIIADLISLAQSKSILSALVVSGDADLTPGVQAAQGLGIRVHLLSMGPTNATSPFLKAEVDQKKHWDDSTVKKFISAKTIVAPASIPAAASAAVGPTAAVQPNPLEQAAKSFFDALQEAEKKSLTKAGTIPKLLDAKLLTVARKQLGRSLTDSEKPLLRVELRKLI